MKASDFRRSLFGYDRREVDGFVKARSDDMEELRVEVDALRSDLEKMVSHLTTAGRVTDETGDRVTRANAAAERVMRMAEKRAVLKLSKAETAAEDLLREAERRTASARREALQARSLKLRLLGEMREFLASLAERVDEDGEDVAREPDRFAGGQIELTIYPETGTDG